MKTTSLIAFAVAALAWTAHSQTCPMLAVSKDVKMEIKNIHFTGKLQITSSSIPLEKTALYKSVYEFAVVTMKVTKPAGTKLTVAACDFTLHYTHGGTNEVAPCIALSSFTKSDDDDRAVQLGDTQRASGPGWLRMSTGDRASEASTVYFDVVFDNIESNVSDIWLCLAQPLTDAPNTAKGWTP